ncbi:hypothetical protein NHX12_007775 [Muraenolepis orangiensis]|uniref:Uncharacterized protein n=1 Tax=Muraenolepis orangiensis TaxID=630683 RepID=A0A9Q0ICC3_9TELE|nr:hypothetical protein NHX12_007775 [Muraenolepis orangiensis]
MMSRLGTTEREEESLLCRPPSHAADKNTYGSTTNKYNSYSFLPHIPQLSFYWCWPSSNMIKTVLAPCCPHLAQDSSDVFISGDAPSSKPEELTPSPPEELTPSPPEKLTPSPPEELTPATESSPQPT